MFEEFISSVKNALYNAYLFLVGSLEIYSADKFEPVLDIGGFLTILAFAVAIFALAGQKYQVRQSISFVPIKKLFFLTLVLSLIFIVISDIIVANQVKIPSFINLNSLNFFISLTIAALVIYWMKICFFRPPRYSRLTAKKFFRVALHSVVNGSDEEMLAIARELMRESRNIIKFLPRKDCGDCRGNKNNYKITDTNKTTYNLFLLLADARFCRVVSKKIPSFPARVISNMSDLNRFDVPVAPMIRQFTIELLSDKNSAIFVENQWLSHGFIGQTKPITRTIFSNWHHIEFYNPYSVSPLDLKYPYAEDWNLETWMAYFGISKEYINGINGSQGSISNSRGVTHILDAIGVIFRRLGKEENVTDYRDDRDPRRHAIEAYDLLEYIIDASDKSSDIPIFDRRDELYFGYDLSSLIVRMFDDSMIYIFRLSTDDFFLIWDIQHNIFWNRLRRKLPSSPTVKMINRKLRRIIWKEVKQMDMLPNYKGAYYVKFCLFVMGFYNESKRKNRYYYKDSWPLAKCVTRWLKKNYKSVASSYPLAAKAMLPLEFSYDEYQGRLIRQSGNELSAEIDVSILELD